jgi:hypothetical protein
MTRTGGSIKKLKGSAIPTAGALSAGKLTGAMLKKALHKHLHPKFEEDLEGAGLFGKLAGIINMGNIKRLYGAIDKGIAIGTKGYSAYKDIKKGVDGMKKKDDEAMIMPSVGMSYGLKAPTATGAGLKSESKRVLPLALRKRAQRLGKLMKQGHSMKVASDMYKDEQKSK